MKRKKDKNTSLIKRVVLKHGPMFASAVIFMFIAVAADFLTPLLLSATIDSIIGGTKPLGFPLSVIADGLGGKSFLANNLWIISIVILLIYVVGGFSQYMRGRFIARASESTAKQMRDALYAHIVALPYDALEKASAGDLIQRCTSDVETVRRFLTNQIIEIFRAVFMLAVSLTVLMGINVKLCLISMALAPILCGFSFFFYGLVRRRFARADASEGKMSAVLQENLAGVRVVRAFGRQAHEMDKFSAANDDLHEKSKSLSDILAIYWSTGDMISALQTGITLTMCIIYAARGELTIGEMTVFVTYVSMLMWPIRQLGRILSDLGKAKVSSGRLNEIMNMPVEDMTKGGLKPPLGRDIAFNGVTFGYSKTGVLRGLSFNAARGETIGILGSTGSGKSTVMRLLDRLYEPDSGSITIGGVDISLIDKSYLRRHIAFVSQDAHLYSRTIRENISFAVRGASQEDIESAAEASRADEFIDEFELGYDTLVGERGVTLSGGQMQRVAIARALLTKADILVFDDSLSAVDTQTDKAIRAELTKKREGVTTFIISHRLTTLCECDSIIVIENGAVAQKGTHEELIHAGGLYSRLYSIESDLKDELGGLADA